MGQEAPADSIVKAASYKVPVYQMKPCFEEYFVKVDSLQRAHSDFDTLHLAYQLAFSEDQNKLKIILTSVDRNQLFTARIPGVFYFRNVTCYLISDQSELFLERSAVDSVSFPISSKHEWPLEIAGYYESTSRFGVTTGEIEGQEFELYFQPECRFSRKDWRRFRKIEMCD